MVIELLLNTVFICTGGKTVTVPKNIGKNTFYPVVYSCGEYLKMYHITTIHT